MRESDVRLTHESNETEMTQVCGMPTINNFAHRIPACKLPTAYFLYWSTIYNDDDDDVDDDDADYDNVNYDKKWWWWWRR